MKKILLTLLAVLFFASPVYSAQTQTEIIESTTLSKSNLAIEGQRYVGDAEKVSFFVTYDSSRETAAVSATVTAAYSIDGINWQDISWFDVAGGATPVTSEVLQLDGNYVGWFDKALTAPIIRIRVHLKDVHDVAYGDGETAGVTVTIVESK